MEWVGPDDALQSYSWDSYHNPYPLTPLSMDFTERLLTDPGFLELIAWERLTPQGGRPFTIVHPHGYVYMAEGKPQQPTSRSEKGLTALQRRVAGQAPRTLEVWEKEHLPRIQAICHRLQRDDYSAMPVRDLALGLEALFDEAASAFGMTMAAAAPMFQVHQWVLGFCRRELDGDAEVLVGTLEQGFANESSASHIALWELAGRARELQDVAGALQTSGDAGELMSALPGLYGGAEFVEAMDGFLDRYGWSTEVWFELSTPPWRDDPRPVFRLLRRYLSGEDPHPRTSLARSAARRRRTAKRLIAELENKPEKIAELQALLVLARQYLPVREGRALWQVALSGSLRRPCLAVGAKLAAAGVLVVPDDIFYLRLGEIEGIATDPRSGSWRAVVEQRRYDCRVRSKTTPPARIGHQPEADDKGDEAAGTHEELRGIAASPGVAQGRAKVLHSLDQADKVGRGDVLVCRSTSPAWTPLFGRVSAVVTDGGSVLSHCGVVAREYGIPCVVGVRTGTERIRDGMLVRVDGGRGTVDLGE